MCRSVFLFFVVFVVSLFCLTRVQAAVQWAEAAVVRYTTKAAYLRILRNSESAVMSRRSPRRRSLRKSDFEIGYNFLRLRCMNMYGCCSAYGSYCRSPRPTARAAAQAVSD